MKKSSYALAALLLFTFVLIPDWATAQNRDRNRSRGRTNNAATTTAAVLIQEGPAEPAVVRQERIRGDRGRSSELQQKIAALPASANASVYMPVLFGIEPGDISPNFGAPRSGGRLHEGEDIISDKGTPIVSPTPAVVLRTGVGATEGNYVYTANPGGETFVYMHLDRIGEGVVSGAVLGQGSLIGYVGDTGNALGGPSHLHFEIHSNGGAAMDPYPRLTGYFSLQEKMSYLSNIMTQTSDPVALAQFLVIYFRDTFTAAQAANIPLPQIIANDLISISPSIVPPTAGGSLPYGDLDLGSSGSLVVTLQRYLISAASGPAATRLAGAGSTGNFGPLTQAALVEYQAKVGISPASGYYGATTRAYIAAHPIGTTGGTTGTTPPGQAVPITPGYSPGGVTVVFTRDLFFGLNGEDVRMLQRVLNANGYAVAATGGGSPGQETAYFGPATLAAVIRFQLARNIAPPAGRVGPLTRAALSSL